MNSSKWGLVNISQVQIWMNFWKMSVLGQETEIQFGGDLACCLEFVGYRSVAQYWIEYLHSVTIVKEKISVFFITANI